MLKKILLALRVLLGLFVFCNVIRQAVNQFIAYANTGKTLDLVSGILLLIVLVPVFYNPVLFKKKELDSEKVPTAEKKPEENTP